MSGLQPPRVSVAQIGARMHYAVPVLLERAGMLERFYADAYAGRGSWLRGPATVLSYVPDRWLPASAVRMRSRREDSLSATKISAFNVFGVLNAIQVTSTHSLEARQRVYHRNAKYFCQRVVASGLGEAGGIYCFNTAALEIFVHARSHDMVTLLEQTSAPAGLRTPLCEEESTLWPGWEVTYPPRSVWQPTIDREGAEWGRASKVLCASRIVAEGLTQMGVDREKIEVVPYGVDVERYASIVRPSRRRGEPLRVLFLGALNLNKGIQYLYEAVGLLDPATVECRAVGAVSILDPHRRRLAERLTVTGLVPRSEVLNHYEWADVFVFPSLSEGSATVIYEALAAGLPVITTPNSGSVVREGVDGFIVPIRDPQAIAQRIQQLNEDRDSLAEMSGAARTRATEYSWACYGERLVGAVRRAFT